MELTRMPPPGRLDFMVPEGTMQASKGRTRPTVPCNYDAYEPQWPLAWHNNFRGAMMATYLGGSQ